MMLHETLLNILQRNDCSQMVEVTIEEDDEPAPHAAAREEQPGKAADSPTNESSDSAICEVERMSESPDVLTVETKPIFSKPPSAGLVTDLDSHSKEKPVSKKDYPLTAAHNITFVGEDPLPEMNPDGSTEI